MADQPAPLGALPPHTLASALLAYTLAETALRHIERITTPERKPEDDLAVLALSLSHSALSEVLRLGNIEEATQ